MHKLILDLLLVKRKIISLEFISGVKYNDTLDAEERDVFDRGKSHGGGVGKLFLAFHCFGKAKLHALSKRIWEIFNAWKNSHFLYCLFHSGHS